MRLSLSSLLTPLWFVLALAHGCAPVPGDVGREVAGEKTATPTPSPSLAPTPTPTPVPTASPGKSAQLGTFQVVSGISLATARAQHSSQVIGSYLYVIGGQNHNGALDSIERAHIGASGNVEPFVLQPTGGLNIPRYGHSSAVIGSYLYVFGGADTNGAALVSVERAVINTNGRIGPFEEVQDLTLALARYGAACLLTDQAVYLVGGDGNTQMSVERAGIREDGTLEPFEEVLTNSLTLPRFFPSALRLGANWYLFGGEYEVASERALLTGAGLGPFSRLESASLMGVRGMASAQAVGSYVYLLGGRSAQTEASLERAAIQPDGGVGPFEPLEGIVLTRPSVFHTSHVIGPYLYVVGGSDDEMVFYQRLERARIE